MNALGMGFGHPHLHGANMAFSAATYLEAGGIEPLDRWISPNLRDGENLAFVRR
jgi:hypothetical protein